MLAVATVAVVELTRTSPGPLTAVHARLSDLEGRAGCAECHGGWTRTMTSACLECHDAIGDHIQRRRGLHGALGRKAEDCAGCHSDHHGEGFAIVNLQSFARAGVSHPGEFDHARIGWEMNGKHLELDCSECHKNADTRILPEKEHRYLGLAQRCDTCHEDAHEGRMALACAECHGQTSFAELDSQGHERHLPLAGGHGDVSCRTCHVDGGERSLEELGRPGADFVPRACQDCHDSPHAVGFVQGVAALVERAPGASCVTCHVAEHESFREKDLPSGGLNVSAALHASSGFALDLPHDTATCKDCHGSPRLHFAERYPGRGPDECSKCHSDPHDGQFATGPFSQGDCIACHERERFAPHGFDVDDHARTALPLDGKHVETKCEDCHERPSEDAARVFRGTAAKCDGCHSDAHDGFFARHAQELARAEHGTCASCHATTSFADVADFDHLRWTDFEVDGAHAQETCEACHARSAEPDLFGRSFGRVAVRYGQIKGCESCHDDPHRGEFDAPGLPRRVGERTGCTRCHMTTSFRSLAPDWSHRRWTGFELDGAHEAAECSACHRPIRAAKDGPDAGRTWQRAAGDHCADCHADPHGRQFDVHGKTSCERCHESAEAWSELDFDHGRDARFALGAAHAGVACAGCHLPAAADDPSALVRYRPLPMECVDCHGTHEGPALKRKGR